MKEYRYSPDKPILVTEETTQKTQYSFLKNNNLWEPSSIQYFYSLVERKHQNKNAVIVDVGAQSGLYSLYAKFLPECQFYSFEPFEDTYALLLDNLQLNQIYNVKAYNYALGSKDETKTLHVPVDHFGLNTLGESPRRFSNWKDVQVHVKCLDDLIPEGQHIDYMKIDTEGWEYHVLRGAEGLIRKWKPELFVEFNEENLRQCGMEMSDLRGLLESFGYREVCCIDYENFHFTPI